MDNAIIGIIDYMFIWVPALCILLFLWSQNRAKMAPAPLYRIHDIVIAPDYKWGEGEEVRCRVGHIETRWSVTGKPSYYYWLIIEHSGYPLTVAERIIQKA